MRYKFHYIAIHLNRLKALSFNVLIAKDNNQKHFQNAFQDFLGIPNCHIKSQDGDALNVETTIAVKFTIVKNVSKLLCFVK